MTRITEPARYAIMDQPKPATEMTDLELRQEWNCIDCDTADTERTNELAAELERRQIDI